MSDETLATSTDVALIKQQLSYVQRGVDSLNEKVDKNYVPMAEFIALKNRVDLFHKTTAYILVIIGLSIIAAVLRATVLK